MAAILRPFPRLGAQVGLAAHEPCSGRMADAQAQEAGGPQNTCRRNAQTAGATSALLLNRRRSYGAGRRGGPFHKTSRATLSAHLEGVPDTTPIEIWFQDEARIGQKNGQVRQWARRGTRPRQPADQRYDNAYLFGAICPARGVGAALALPYADTEAMQLHIDEISTRLAEGAHAVLLLDRAGWNTTRTLDGPENITPIFLPSRAPHLNPVENVWQYVDWVTQNHAPSL